jgi:proteic killer suppression protein
MPLQLSFTDSEVQHLCESRAAAEKLLGQKAARKLRARLADLCAAEKISEVVVGSPKPVGRGTFVIALHPPHKLILEPAMNPIPTKDGSTDWDAIECFRVRAVN